jgi:hypothetical protein
LVAGEHGDDRVDAGLLHEPRDLFLPAHPPMLESRTTHSLGDGKAIGYDPGETPGF